MKKEQITKIAKDLPKLKKYRLSSLFLTKVISSKESAFSYLIAVGEYEFGSENLKILLSTEPKKIKNSGEINSGWEIFDKINHKMEFTKNDDTYFVGKETGKPKKISERFQGKLGRDRLTLPDYFELIPNKVEGWSLNTFKSNGVKTQLTYIHNTNLIKITLSKEKDKEAFKEFKNLYINFQKKFKDKEEVFEKFKKEFKESIDLR